MVAEGHEKMTTLAGQLINLGLIGNTIGDMVRIYEKYEDYDTFPKKTNIYVVLLYISLGCQLIYIGLALWRFLYLRSKREGDSDDDCCEEPCGGCNCCRGTGEILFTLSFIMTAIIMVLQVVCGVLGAVYAVNICSPNPK